MRKQNVVLLKFGPAYLLSTGIALPKGHKLLDEFMTFNVYVGHTLEWFHSQNKYICSVVGSYQGQPSSCSVPSGWPGKLQDLITLLIAGITPAFPMKEKNSAEDTSAVPTRPRTQCETAESEIEWLG